MDLVGKRTIITGAASGIGRATTEVFLRSGAIVAALDRNSEGLLSLSDSLDPTSLHTFQTELTQKVDCDSAVMAAIDFLGSLDVLVCVAGGSNGGALHETGEELWDLIIDRNLKSTYLTVHAAWPYLVDAGGGVVLTTGSICSFWGYPRLAAYGAAKAGVLILTKCLAIDGAPYNIRANIVCPGETETPLLDRSFETLADPENAKELASKQYPLGRFAQAAEIASAFAFLASNEAAYLTGAQITIDGGRTCGYWVSAGSVS